MAPLLEDLNLIQGQGYTPDPSAGKSKMYWLYMKSLKRAILNNKDTNGFTDVNSRIENRVLVASSRFFVVKPGLGQNSDGNSVEHIFTSDPRTESDYMRYVKYVVDGKYLAVTGTDCFENCDKVGEEDNDDIVSAWATFVSHHLEEDDIGNRVPLVGASDAQFARLDLTEPFMIGWVSSQ